MWDIFIWERKLVYCFPLPNLKGTTTHNDIRSLKCLNRKNQQLWTPAGQSDGLKTRENVLISALIVNKHYMGCKKVKIYYIRSKSRHFHGLSVS